MSSYGAKGTRTPNNRLQRTVRYAAVCVYRRSDGPKSPPRRGFKEAQGLAQG